MRGAASVVARFNVSEKRCFRGSASEHKQILGGDCSTVRHADNFGFSRHVATMAVGLRRTASATHRGRF